MVTLDGRRWPAGLHNTPARFGKLVEYDRFDATFFSVHGKQSQARPARAAACSRPPAFPRPHAAQLRRGPLLHAARCAAQ